MEVQEKGKGGRAHKKNSMIIPLILVFIFMTVMVVYVSSLMYRVAVSNSNAVMEDRILTVSAMIDSHLNTAENVLHVAGDSVHHMLISGTTTARIHEFLVDETVNVAEQFDENYTGLYGFIMGKYIDGLNWEPPEGYDPKTRDWFIVAKQANGEVVFSPPYIDAQTGNMIISACRMLPDKQSVIALDVQLHGIQSMMKELTVSGKGYGFVVDENGLIIAHRDESKKGTNLCDMAGGEELLKAVRETGSGTFSHTWEGEESIIYANRIANDWSVIMVVSDRELYSEVHSQRIVIAIICTLIFFMIAAFYFIGHRNEQMYAKNMEEMRLEEQRASYERKVLELEKDTANASNKAKSDFLANMSHEIRTPMNAIIGMDEMILRESTEPKVRKYAANIQSAGKTLLSIINDILDLSKIESGKMELMPVEYPFSSVLNDIVNMTMKKAEDKGLVYNLRVSPQIPSRLRGDEIRVRQVMLNLINNAIKYTEKGSVSISISYEQPEKKLIIEVADTGIGIRPEDMNKLFQSFQRLEENRNRSIEGTGLGLGITKRLAEMMGGCIRVSSTYGEGTTFTAELVQETVDATPIGDYTETLAQAVTKREEYRPTLVAPDARVLIIDDNDMNLEVISSLLSDTRIQISTGLSGEECIRLLREGHYDVIMLDQMMPGMSGVQTLEIIRKEKLAEGTPVIALTADAIVTARETYLRSGFTDYLSKPVIYEKLEAMLRKYLDERLILTEEEQKKQRPDPEKAEAPPGTGEKKALVLAISDSSDELKRLKRVLGEDVKGVYVKDRESAARYLAKEAAKEK